MELMRLRFRREIHPTRFVNGGHAGPGESLEELLKMAEFLEYKPHEMGYGRIHRKSEPDYESPILLFRKGEEYMVISSDGARYLLEECTVEKQGTPIERFTSTEIPLEPTS